MKIGGIILCRLDSRRLPGKILRRVNGKPLLSYVVARAKMVTEIDGNLVVATTNRGVDDFIQDYCEEQGVQVFRGPTENVAQRVLLCAQEHEMTHFARINADSPFLEPTLVAEACRIAEASDSEIVTNLYPRTFPYGISVELFRTETFQRGFEQMHSEDHFEHVSLYFYQNMARFKFHNIAREGEDLGDVRLTVDTEADLDMFRRMVDTARSDWAEWSYIDAVDAYRRLSVAR